MNATRTVRRVIVARPRVAAVTAAAAAARPIRRAAVVCRNAGPVALPVALVGTAPVAPAVVPGGPDGQGAWTGTDAAFGDAADGIAPFGTAWPGIAYVPAFHVPGSGPNLDPETLLPPGRPVPDERLIGSPAPDAPPATAIPEPSTVAVLCLALLVLAAVRLRRA